MKRFLCFVLALLIATFTFQALAEEAEKDSLQISDTDTNLATPAIDRSLQELLGHDYPEDAKGTDEVFSEPFIPDEVLPDRRIVGTDDRRTVSNPAVYPYSAVAYMVVHAECGCDWTGSAFMVGKRGAMTASHCLVCTTHNRCADRITLYFGHKPNGSYFYKYDDATSYWYGISGGGNDRGWDYGYIRLNRNVGDKTGWFGTRSMSDSALNGALMNLAGYRQGEMKRDFDYVTVVNANVIDHRIDTEKGYSGCPIYDDDYYAVAINVAEYTNFEGNIGRRITGSLQDDMRAAGIFD